MIADYEINLLATYMVETHGLRALRYAEMAADELDLIGETVRADAWRQLRGVVLDIVENRRDRTGQFLH